MFITILVRGQPEIAQITWQGSYHLAFPLILGSPRSTVPFPLVRVSITVLHSYIWQYSYYCPDVSVHGDWHTDQASLVKQLVMYGRIPYLNNSLSSWAIHRSNLRHLPALLYCSVTGCLTKRVPYNTWELANNLYVGIRISCKLV